MSEQMLKAKVKQYELLKNQQKMLERRLVDLRAEILEAAMKHGKATTPNTYEYPAGDYIVTVRHKTRNDINESKLEHLLLVKGLWKMAMKEVVDHDLVEQLYLEGRLDDSDLRSVRAPKNILSLHVEPKNVSS